jgi:hypothetical protein
MNPFQGLAAAAKPTARTALFCLLCMGMAGRVTATQADRLIAELLAMRTQECMAQKISSGMHPKALDPRVMDGPHGHSSDLRRLNSLYWRTCGFGGVGDLNGEPRTTKLPADPILVLGESYLKCQMIKAALLEPTVSVEFYPPGYFGEYEYEGLLASDRFEFSDEATLEKLFKLLVEVVKVPDNGEMIEDFLYDFEEPELKLADYRKQTGFFPEFIFEFVGEKPLRMEINLTKGRLLIQAGDQWDGYEIDRRSAAALRELLLADRKKVGG